MKEYKNQNISQDLKEEKANVFVSPSIKSNLSCISEKTLQKIKTVEDKYALLISKASSDFQKQELILKRDDMINRFKDLEQNPETYKSQKERYDEKLRRIDKENRYKAGTNNSVTYFKDFKQICQKGMDELKELPVTLSTGGAAIALPQVYNRYWRRNELHSRNRYGKLKKTSKEVYLILRHLGKQTRRVFEYIVDRCFYWKENGCYLFEGRERISNTLGCSIRTVTNAYDILIHLGFIRRINNTYNGSNTLELNERFYESEYIQALRSAFYDAEYTINKIVGFSHKAILKARGTVKSVKAYLKNKTKSILNRITQEEAKRIKEETKKKNMIKLVEVGVEDSWIRTLMSKYSFNVILHNLKKAKEYSRKSKIRSWGRVIYNFCLKDH